MSMPWMRHKEFQRWLERRRHGVWPYVWKQGVLLYGLPMFVITSVLLHRQGQPAWLLGVSLLFWLSGGALFGWLLWRVNEWRFRRVLRRVAESEPSRHRRED